MDHDLSDLWVLLHPRKNALSGAHFLVVVLIGFGAASCTEDPEQHPPQQVGDSPTESGFGIEFSDITAEAGIDFRHETGFDEQYWFPEIVGPGCAVFDFDGDGWQDLFFVDGGRLSPASDGSQSAEPAHRLYRNLGIETGSPRFEDATARSGITGSGYGQGCAVGDYDGDGDADLYLTNVGPNQLYRNDGGGQFTEVARVAGVDAEGWSTSASFTDLDRDGDLDLYVAGYCLWSNAAQVPCKSGSGEPDYCNPKAFEMAPDVYYRNRGDGTFDDATVEAGFSAATGRGLGVLCADFDGDGRLDVYVANDGDPNNLWIQSEDGSFLDEGLLSGSALNASGETEASMGVTVTDLGNDGDWDLFMTHMDGETNTLYRNEGAGLFLDATGAALGSPSRAYTGFGALFFDANLDGDVDLFIANGAVIKGRDAGRGSWPYAQRDQFFVGHEGSFFELDPSRAPWLFPEAVGRGAAIGDLDRDGDLDLVVANAGAAPRVLRNDSVRGGHWLGILLADESHALGSQVLLQTIESRGSVESSFARLQRVSRDGSFASANEARAVFAISQAPSVASAEVWVQWADGRSEAWTLDHFDRDWILERGAGDARPDLSVTEYFRGGGEVAAVSPKAPASFEGVAKGLDAVLLRANLAGAATIDVPKTVTVPALPSLEKVDDSVAHRVRDAHDALRKDPDRAEFWKSYGLALFADVEDWSGAASALEQTLIRSPDDVRSVYLLALCEGKRGNVNRQRAFLSRSIELDPAYLPARLRLSASFLESGDIPEAEALTAESLALDSDSAEALILSGRIRRELADPAASIEQLRRAVELAPTSRGAHYELGIVLRETGNLEEAREHLETANGLRDRGVFDPWMNELTEGRGGDNALLTSANQARLAGKLERARELYAEYVERQPEDPVGWVNLAAVERDSGHPVEARVAAERAIVLDPGNASSLALLAGLHASAGDLAIASDLLERAIAIDPMLAQAHYDLGLVRAAMMDPTGAEGAYSRYVELLPSDPRGWEKLGESAIALRNLEEARTAYEQLLKLDPDHVAANFRCGGFALAGQDYQRALALFTNALRLQPGWPEAHIGRARALQMAGRMDEAIDAAARAVELRPDSERFRATLEQLRALR